MMVTGHTDWHFGMWKMHWRNSNVETLTEKNFCSSFNFGKGEITPIVKAVTSGENMNVIVRETKSTLQIYVLIYSM